MYKDFNTRLTKLQERAELSNPRHMLKKLLQDIDNLEKFYTDREYRNRLVKSARYPSSEYFQLEKIYDQEEKVKEKLNLPQNCTIRYEKVKCCKDCKHNTHQYYYAYIWDCDSKKLKKKYIGKQLPLPTTI
jgi:ribosomal protein L37AE/L43A